MLKEAIGSGETVEEAQKNAIEILGINPDEQEYEFEILQLPEKKVLGLFGGGKAKVRVYLPDEPSDIAETFLNNMLRLLDLNSVNVSKTESENGITFDIEGEEVGALIGKRGETLDAIQYLTNLAANHGESYLKITLNVGDFREKREKTLESLGRSLAIKTSKTGRKNKLEPMNPYERRIIHTAVQNIKGAISWSEGDGINRHVVIGPDPEFRRNNRYPSNNRGGYNGQRRPYNNNGNRFNNNNRSYNNNRNNENSENKDKKPINEAGNVGLYGRIDKND